MKTVFLNASNIVYDPLFQNTKLQYNFPSTQEFKDHQIALGEMLIAYTWVNISSYYGNDIFAYIWYSAGVPTINYVVVPSGFYTYNQLNAYMNNVMATNNHYLIDANGDPVFYLEWLYNPSELAMELRSTPIPTALPAGYSAPVGFPGFPAVATTPVMFIPATNIQQLLGFTAGLYPPAPQATIYNVLGTAFPQITEVQNIIVECSLVKNDLQYPNDILYTFVPEALPAYPVAVQPTQYIWTDVQDGYYSTFTVSFVNQNFERFSINDPNLFVQLILKKKDEVVVKR